MKQDNPLPNTRWEGRCEKIKTHVFDIVSINQADQYTPLVKEIIEYVELEHGSLAASTLRNMKTEVIEKPTAPDKTELVADGTTKMMEELDKMIWVEEIKEHLQDKKRLKNTLKKLHALIWGQTGDAMRTKIRDLDDYETVKIEQDPVKLLELVRRVTYNVQTTAYYPATQCTIT